MADQRGGGAPLDVFRLSSGHRVSVYPPGAVGLPVYGDHEVVLLEDTGSRAGNRLAAAAAVAHQKR